MGPGRSYPLGATVLPGGVNFAVYSRYAKQVEILLFESASDKRPTQVISLDPQRNLTYDYWHAYIPGLSAGQIYAFRADGPFEPERGLRFDRDKVLLDPYGKCVARPPEYDREAARRPGDNCATALKSVAVDQRSYDWEDDEPPRIPFSKSVIYEMHVAGLTKHPSSGVDPALRGTYAGVIEKIPYLKDLGITAVELLPVFAFDEQDSPPQLTNYWGYSPVSFFAPHPLFSSRKDPLGVLDEFRDLVKAMHRAGLEVILDVVYNHTAEGGHDGPTLCFRGLANGLYYHLQDNKALYADFTGCGNTVNANQSVVRRLILDSLCYWVRDMHVDGFRFDLASVLSRDQKGTPMRPSPVVQDIQSDPVLSNIKLIAEAWDAAGLYQVGSFAGYQWKEWNGKFRDDIRSFVRGDPGLVTTVAFRLLGSPDVYQTGEGEPERSVNFVTCHDGFTLNDLVSYNDKHNEVNLEGNRDGYNDNRSWNCGVEGPSDDPAIESLRNRQVKNLLAATMLSVGTPMFPMGDEGRRTQLGNNNAYSQDSEISWFDWTLLDKHCDVHRFVRKLIAYRLNREMPIDDQGLSLIELMHRQQVHYHGVKLHQPDRSPASRSLALTAFSPGGHVTLYLAINAFVEDLHFELPEPGKAQGDWRRWIDTSLASPHDICSWHEAPVVRAQSYTVKSRSVVALLASAGH